MEILNFLFSSIAAICGLIMLSTIRTPFIVEARLSLSSGFPTLDLSICSNLISCKINSIRVSGYSVYKCRSDKIDVCLWKGKAPISSFRDELKNVTVFTPYAQQLDISFVLIPSGETSQEPPKELPESVSVQILWSFWIFHWTLRKRVMA